MKTSHLEVDQHLKEKKERKKERKKDRKKGSKSEKIVSVEF